VMLHDFWKEEKPPETKPPEEKPKEEAKSS
jgi:hypothetical protein